MEIQARLLLVAVFGIVIAIGFANAVQGETATPVVVGLAKCSDCARRNMNAEAAFKGLQVAVKCRNSKGEYESTAVGQVGKSGAFSVPLAADVVGEDGELKSECFAQLHSASSAPCPGQEPSKIVAAPPGGHDGTEKTFVALGGKVYRSSPECASAFLCHPFFHSVMHHHHHVGIHTPVVIPHLPDHGHGHSIPPVTNEPPAVGVPEHKPAPVPVPEHEPPSTATAPSTPPVYSHSFQCKILNKLPTSYKWA
ncbi:proline-rich protein 4-like [Miscanthus floridulus]|uniref:proline-rich protein 4-like n=1 Tax=Miscanthus floridulus TaxID=154761 RepID=UPI0034575D2B